MTTETNCTRPQCIGFLGADWWGSDARAVAMEFRRQGHIVIERNYEDFFPTRWTDSIRIMRRIAKRWMAANYNRSIEELLKIDSLDFLLVFKGMLLSENTLNKFCARNIPAYCFYPDVSMKTHGANIIRCMPLYKCVFTTKRYHLRDSPIRAIAKDLVLVHHGFDPDVHRPIAGFTDLNNFYSSDVSFVGAWSPKKEKILTYISTLKHEASIKIWGPGWERANRDVRCFWQGRGAYGDELVAIYCGSKINLGLLSEKSEDSLEGDSTTVRTWQIPACGAFLLHEKTNELEDFFVSDKEVGVFSEPVELIPKIRHYLAHATERVTIAEAGRRRCYTSRYDYSGAVSTILDYHKRVTNN